MKHVTLLAALLVFFSLTNRTRAQCSATITSSVASNHIDCNTTSLTLTVATQGTTGELDYTWSNGAKSNAINVISKGTYSVTVKDASGCSTQTEVTITEDVTPPKLTVLTFPGSTICAGTQVTFIALGAETLLWTSLSKTGAVVTDNPGTSTAYTLTGISASNGCRFDTTIQVTVNPLPTATISSTSTACLNSTQTLTFNGSGGTKPYTFAYTLDNGAKQAISTGGTSSSASLAIPTGVTKNLSYNLLSVSDGFGCINTSVNAATAVTVVPGPLLSSRKEVTICNNTLLMDTARSSVAGTVFHWERISNPNIISDGPASKDDSIIHETLQNRSVNPVVVKYVFRLSTGSGCVTIDTLRVTVNPTPGISGSRVAITVCNGNPVAPVPLSSSSTGAFFTWTNSNSDIGLPVGGSGSLPSFTASNRTNATIQGTIRAYVFVGNNCPGDSLSFPVLVLPGPALTSPKKLSVCDNAPFSYTARSSAQQTVFNWERLPNAVVTSTGRASNTDSVITGTFHNPTPQPVVISYLIHLSTGGSCKTTDTLSITVEPTPKITTLRDTTFCSGASVDSLPFRSVSPNATFTWVNDNLKIGLSGSGSGNIPSFIATNTDTSTMEAKITVSIKAGMNACPGTDATFPILVKPGPFLMSRRDTVVCNDVPFTYTALSSDATASITWERLADSLVNGGKDSSGNGQILNDRLLNKGAVTVPVTYNFRLSPSKTETGCAVVQPVKFMVKPTPRIDPVSDSKFCNGFFVSDGIRFSSTTSDPSFRWKQKGGADIGLPSDTIGSILPFNVRNTGISDSIAYVTAYAFTGNNCPGDSTDFTVIVRPGPKLKGEKLFRICSDSLFTYTAEATTNAEFGWSRAQVNGVSALAASGQSAVISERLDNILDDTVAVNYLFTLRPPLLGNDSSCASTDIVKVIVNPTPKIKKLTNQILCNNSVSQQITFDSSTKGSVIYRWINEDRNIGLPDSGTGIIPAFLTNNSGPTILASKIDVSSSIDGCPGQAGSFTFSVQPTAILTSMRSTSVCSDSVFSYTASSFARPTKFTWERLHSDSISSNVPPGREDSVIIDTLHNNYATPAVVRYHLTLITGNNCVTNDTLSVTVNPNPVVEPILDTIFCNNIAVDNGIQFSSTTPGATFHWSNDNTEIGLPASGSGNIPKFVATNATAADISATITVYALYSSNSCRGKDTKFKITVRPSPPRPSFTSLFNTPDDKPLVLCNKSANVNFNINSPVTGVRYRWSSPVTNPAVVQIRNPGQPNTVVSFRSPQSSLSIIAQAENTTTGCTYDVAQLVTVQQDSVVGSDGRIFTMQPGNLLVYSDNRPQRYQWGYDSIIRRLGGDTVEHGPSQLFAGQTNQFFIPDARGVDVNKYLYWVQLSKNTCTTRVYYNGLYRPQRRIQPDPVSSEVQLQVLPNPNSGQFEVLLKGNIYGRINARVYNSLGVMVFQKNFVKTIPVVNETFSAGHLPAGLYVVEIVSSDLKKVMSRFVVQR